MPEISRFYGIIIRMFYEKGAVHHKPHIHVTYGEYHAQIGLDGEILSGDIPAVQYKMLIQWMIQHKEELNELWSKAVEGKTLEKIAPYQKKKDSSNYIAEDGEYKAYGKGWTKVLEAVPLENKVLLLRFSNGKSKLFDTTCLEGEAYEPLKDESVFQNVSVDSGVVSWFHGSIDCNPKFMYLNGFDYNE
ncbi:MAG: DUF4160 domain-containing protein [Eubacterium sp.]|nr:DUF4160 domain-containing protein [Eubacterium sp.]